MKASKWRDCIEKAGFQFSAGGNWNDIQVTIRCLLCVVYVAQLDCTQEATLLPKGVGDPPANRPRIRLFTPAQKCLSAETMSQFWEQRLTHIREKLLMMSGLVERDFLMAMRALLERDDKLADAVESADGEIDQLEVEIDDMVITYMATHAPVAGDCRLMLSASKISTNLERIADCATKIARRARELNREPLLKPLIDIPVMADTAHEMLQDSISAFVDGNDALAVEILARDRTVDSLNKQVARELTEGILADPKTVTRAMHLITIAQAIERAADHATNIAEEVFFLCKGEDIRHEHSLKKQGVQQV